MKEISPNSLKDEYREGSGLFRRGGLYRDACHGLRKRERGSDLGLIIDGSFTELGSSFGEDVVETLFHQVGLMDEGVDEHLIYIAGAGIELDLSLLFL
ncbi:MAG: hypothetical protein ABEH38_02675 [Flavobacteriales bacterium]